MLVIFLLVSRPTGRGGAQNRYTKTQDSKTSPKVRENLPNLPRSEARLEITSLHMEIGEFLSELSIVLQERTLQH